MKTKKNFNRRDFIGMTVAGSSILLTQSRETLSNQNTVVREIITQPNIRVRHSIHSSDKTAQKNVKNFRRAVAKMKAISKNDPRNKNKMGWIAQAEIHLKNCGGTDPKIDVHNSGLFLPWHRAYIFFFEEICRQLLKEDGVDDFALPYWNWTDFPQMPEIFGKNVWDEDLKTVQPPAAWNISNWERTICPNQAIKEDLQVTNILNSNNIVSILGIDSLGAPGTGLQIGPHAIIHNVIGGNMKQISAPLDPIFWLHHANIDRLWSNWMKNYPDNTPSPNCQPEGCGDECLYPLFISNWLKETTSGFFDINQASVNRQVKDLLDTFNPTHLGYRYDDSTPIVWSRCPRIQTTSSGDSIKSKNIGETAKMNDFKTVRVGDFLDLESDAKILENINISIKLMLQSQITVKSSLPSSSLLMSLEFEKPVNPAIAVRVFINAPPDKSDLSTDSPSYVATFSFFERAQESHHHDKDDMNTNLSENRRLLFDITNIIIKLSESTNSKQYDLKDTRISIIPKLLANNSSNWTENLKLMSFRFDLSK